MIEVRKDKVKLECNIKVVSNDIDNALHKLAQSVNLPVGMLKNIQQGLQKQQNGMASIIEIYVDIEGLFKGIELEDMKLSKTEISLIKQFLKDLTTIRVLEKQNQRIKELEKQKSSGF